MGKRKSSGWAPHRVAARILFGDERNHPTPRRVARVLFGPKAVASIRRDPGTGTVTARGARRRADGTWELKSGRRSRTYRAPAAGVPRTGAVPDRRRDDRRQDGARGSKRSPQAREYRQGAGGRMAGSGRSRAKVPAPAALIGLNRLRCDWCRGSGHRPIYTQAGRILTVIGSVECGHAWAITGGPAQKAPAASSRFSCPSCDSTGQMVVDVAAHGTVTKHSMPCAVCKGWTPFWNGTGWGAWKRKQRRRTAGGS